MAKSYAGQVLTELVDKNEKLTYYMVAKGANMDQGTVRRIAKGEIKDPKVSQLKKLAKYFSMDVAEFIEPRPGVKQELKIPEKIQDFIHFYYVDRTKPVKYNQSAASMGKVLKKQFEDALKVYLKDLDTLTHNPESAERIFNKLQERSYQLVSDKDKFDNHSKTK